MPKKSNKTAHVLSLLTKEKEPQDTQEMEEMPQLEEGQGQEQQPDAPPIAQQSTAKKLPLKRKPPEKKYPRNTPIIEVKDEKDDILSNLIKEELTKMLENETNKTTVPTASVSPASADEKPMQSEADMFRQNAALLEQESITTHHQSPTEQDDDETLLFCVNVVELILKDRITEYMDMVGMCTCERCTKDTMAIALNHIPPKYVVTNKGRLLAQLDLYDKQLAATFMVEVIKAGVMVKSCPRH